MSPSSSISLNAVVPGSLSGSRLDQVAAALFSDFSRSRLQIWIKSGCVLVNGQQLQPKEKLYAGDEITLETEYEPGSNEENLAENMPLDIIHEDEHLIVLNKAVNVVVHPAAGNRSGTLMNGLLHYCPALAGIPRAGIVHRLDKDTSGLMMVAKTLQAHHALVKQLQRREVTREYEAVVNGVMTGGGSVDLPIGRHPINRKKQAVNESGKEAVTHYRVLNRFRAHTHIRVKLETGRTHQIRVHMSHIHYPLVGDPLYGGRLQIPKACSKALEDELRKFRRQALHARKLGVTHPVSNEYMQWEVGAPADFIQLLDILADDSR
ncbi:MAG: 23S rRNA pseudouridine(1911/1915/1917) synthase RluD [Pseudomonadales bacterium]|nr:23S rRNA pseudouridine(1911/1915/1917) synthase RluD [Pseudomonadales bacterium]